MESTSTLCKYRYLFGVEGQGAHKYRIFNIAIVDTVATILVAWVISYFFHVSFWKTFIVLFILGLLLHRVFCVQTTLTKAVFGKY